MFHRPRRAIREHGRRLCTVPSQCFKAEVDRCAELLQPHLGLDLRQLLFPRRDQVKMAEKIS